MATDCPATVVYEGSTKLLAVGGSYVRISPGSVGFLDEPFGFLAFDMPRKLGPPRVSRIRWHWIRPAPPGWLRTRRE